MQPVGEIVCLIIEVRLEISLRGTKQSLYFTERACIVRPAYVEIASFLAMTVILFKWKKYCHS